MSVILGLNFSHADSAACLVVDGELKSAIAEERLGKRIKHDSAFPAESIRRQLADAGLELKDVTHVAIGADPSSNYAAKAKYVLSRPIKSAGAVVEHFRRRKETQSFFEQLAEICGAPASDAKFEVCRVEHHLAHIASSYYLSPFEELTAGFSFDGSGDFVSAMAARCEGTKIEVLDRVHLPHSLGFFYTAICQYIGFDQFGEEYKVMGLSGYGEDKYQDLMRKLVSFDDSSWFKLATPYFGMHEGGVSGEMDENHRVIMGQLYTDKLVQELGPPRKRTDEMDQRAMDLAMSCQARFEEVAMHCFNRLHKMVPTERIAYAGGCGLNGVANARMLRDTPFTQPYIQCAASDDGTCVGAAYHCYHNMLGVKERHYMDQAYLGPQYPEEQMRRAAEACGMPMRDFGEEAVIPVVAKLLREGLVTGWYQGRSEWGPRALGNRSILADPTRADMKDLINTKIKRREQFRPFAPTVLKEDVGAYFEQDILSPFMMHVVKIRPEWRERLPAVSHVDGTGRLQSIERRHNPRYYDLIKAFSELSGASVVLNTSFNENEPIVDTPEQATACFTRTGMDAICLGGYVVVKPEHAEKLEAAAGAAGAV